MADTVCLTASILGDRIAALEIPWTPGTTILSAMEYTRDSSEAPGFSFLLGYYGTEVGYLLHEVRHIGNQPRVYWLVAVNGETSHTGVDKVELKAGDAVTVTFSYDAGEVGS